MSSERVLVTGATGFVAAHVIQQLQQSGYQVRGTVRDLNNEKKVKPIKELCPDAAHPVELVQADLLVPDTWSDAVKDCDYVMHIANTVPTKPPSDGTKLIQTEIDGTLTVLRACQEAKTVKRVVVTSSTAAVDVEKKEGLCTEEDWLDCNKKNVPWFYKNKALAEKAAWDFVNELPEEERFELSVVNVSFAMGPILNGALSSAQDIPKNMLEGDMPLVPQFNVGVIDVRDVALAHIKAMTVPEAAGHRHILVSGNMWFKEIAKVIGDEFNPQGYNVKNRGAPYWLLWVIGRFNSSVRLMLPVIGKVTMVDNTRMRTVLGIEPRSTSEAILSLCYSLVENGWAKKTDKYTGPKYLD